MEEAEAKCCANAFPNQRSAFTISFTACFRISAYITLKIGPKQRKPPGDRTQPEPTSNNEEVDNPAEKLHASSDSGNPPRVNSQETPSVSQESVSQETSSENLQLNSPGVEALNVEIPNSTNKTLTASETQRDCAELKKQLADLERRYTVLQEHHTHAKNAIQNLKKKVRKHSSVIIITCIITAVKCVCIILYIMYYVSAVEDVVHHFVHSVFLLQGIK